MKVSLLRGFGQPVVWVGAGTFGLLWTIGVAAGLLGLWLLVVIGAALVRYPYEITAAAVEGAAEAPPADTFHFTPAMSPQYLLHALTVATLAWWLSQGAGLSPLTVALIMASVVPASIGIMGATRTYLHAINPLGLGELILTLGVDYLAVVAIVVVLWASVLFIDDVVGVALLSRFLMVYALFVTFDVSGRVLHLRRRDLPYVGTTYEDRRELRDREDEQRDWDNALDRIYRMMREGELTAGFAAMNQLLAADGYRPEGYELLYQRVREWQLAEVTIGFSSRFVDRLVIVGQVQRALEVTEFALRLDPRFRPPPNALAAVAEHARSVGHEHTASLLTMSVDEP